jgi:hypothetical protein
MILYICKQKEVWGQLQHIKLITNEGRWHQKKSGHQNFKKIELDIADNGWP